jgi:GMP synthase-like glutamine amidotransferase
VGWRNYSEWMTAFAILESGFPPRNMQPRFGTYASMFEDLLGCQTIEAVYDVTHGALPARPQDHAAYLITGSSAGVYDDLPWIEPLKQFLIAAKGKAKLVGICFGHQIMAEAFGGRVVKSDKGWGIGLHDYRVNGGAPWTDDASRIAVPVCHQDQVIEQPPNTVLIGGNDFCPIGMLAYDDQPAMSVQFHPEFEPAFVDALIDLIGDEIPDPEAAHASLAQPNDRQRVGEWIRRYVDQR